MNINITFTHTIYGDIMRFFNYYKKIFSFILIITFIALFIHSLVCLDIKNFKLSVSHVTKNYTLFKILFPILYISLAISVYKYGKKFENSKNIYMVLALYLLLIIFTIFSSILTLRYAKFIFSFWCILLCVILDTIFCYIIYIGSPKLIYFSGIHVALYSYLSFVVFWLYSQNI